MGGVGEQSHQNQRGASWGNGGQLQNISKPYTQCVVHTIQTIGVANMACVITPIILHIDFDERATGSSSRCVT